MTTPIRNKIVAEALTWEDVPYREQGRSRTGIDCAGFVIVVGRNVGIFSPGFDVQGYGAEPDGTMLQRLVDAGCTEVDEKQPGDIIVMKQWREPAHIGLWTGEHLIHASNSPTFRRVIRHSLRGNFARQVTHVFQYPNG